MKITVVGSGRMGKILAAAMSGGNEVALYDADRENAVRVALRSMGFTNDEMTAHGFRAMASTTLHENGFQSEVIEIQLAHAEKNAVKAAYNHAEYLPERRKLMQWYADFLLKTEV